MCCHRRSHARLKFLLRVGKGKGVVERLGPTGPAHRPGSSQLLGIAAFSTLHAAGADNAAMGRRHRRRHRACGPTTLAWCDLPCWIGEVPGVDDVALPPELSAWDCRNHRLAWLALQRNGFPRGARCGRRPLRRPSRRPRARHQHRRASAAPRSPTPPASTTAAGRPTSTTAAPMRWMRCAASAPKCSACRARWSPISTACSSSAKVFLLAQRWIDAGLIDAAVVGGVDSLCLSTLHGFDSLQLLSAEICRPFDAARNGISIGEAAGFVLLDRAPATVNFVGGGESSDAWHMSTPHPEGQGAQARDAGGAGGGRARRRPTSATSTRTAPPRQANDRSEAAATDARCSGPARCRSRRPRASPATRWARPASSRRSSRSRRCEHQALPPSANLRDAGRRRSTSTSSPQPRARRAAPRDEQQLRLRRQQLLADLRPAH